MKKTHQPIDTLAITESLGLQTFRKCGRKAWTKQEDAKLIQRLHELYPQEASEKTLDPKNIKWDLVAEVFTDKSRKGKDCRKRWASSLNPSLRRGKWTPEEDEQLLKSYEKHGPLWQQISMEVKGRTEHQCLKRYLEVIDPALSNRLKRWTLEEDLLLIKKVEEHGTKWRTIAAAFDARPSLTCRNRWRNLLTSVARGRADKAVMDAMELVTGGNISDKFAIKEESASEDTVRNAGVVDGEASGYEKRPDRGSVSSHTSDIPSDHVANGLAMQQPEKEIEWRYAIVSRDETNENGPFEELIKNGGQINSRELAQYLIQYASVYNMKVTVHQHIHYHYGSTLAGEEGVANDKPAYVSPASNEHVKARYLNVEPETQLQRVQHFNYLPPLTEVPKLNSSASSPSSSKDGGTHHHHHHHHHHHMHDANEEKNMNQNNSYRKHDAVMSNGVNSLADDAQAKESDLLKLLDRADNRVNGSMNRRSHDRTHINKTPVSNAYAPISRSLHLDGNATNNTNMLNKRPLDGYDDQSKRMKIDIPDEEGDDGLDFFETMRNLSAIQHRRHRQDEGIRSRRSSEHRNSGSAKGSPNELKPVSQHHPLHYSQSTVTPAPEPVPIEEEEDELFDVYGLFYNSHPKDLSLEAATQQNSRSHAGILDMTSPFAFPFNPS